MNEIINKILKQIAEHDSIALFHHMMIDGDSLSSSYGLAQAIKAKYPSKNIVVIGDFDEIQNRFPYLHLDKSYFQLKIDSSYLAIIGDCAAMSRIAFHDQYIKAKVKIAFDHHVNDIDFKHDIFWHEPTFIASSIQATFIAEALDIKWTENIALHLVFGILTDSGRFSFSGADPLPLEVAARLYHFIDNEIISNLFYAMNNKSLNDIKYQSWIYSQLQIKEKVGYVIVKKADQIKFNKTPNEATQVNMIGNIEDIEAWAMFVEYPDFIRVEFRSKGTPVNEVAKKFNGGGHLKAAGAKLKSFDQVEAVINEKIKAVKNFL